MSMSSSSIFFTKLAKYKGEINEDLETWLREFARCCLIANKTEADVKGQYLMLCVEGRAKAVLEKFEAEKAEPQKYDDLVAELKRVFNTTASREAKMMMFENRMMRIGETEEDFMLDLLLLYRNANPNATANTLDQAIKRKFLQGISPEMKKNLFIFCNDPFAPAVTRNSLLESCQKAKSLLQNSPNDNIIAVSSVTGQASSSTGNDMASIAQAIQNLSLKLDSHISHTNEKVAEHSEYLAAMGNSNYRGYSSSRGTNRGRYFPRRRGFAPRSRSNFGGRSATNVRICYHCGGRNHIAAHCTANKNSGNW